MFPRVHVLLSVAFLLLSASQTQAVSVTYSFTGLSFAPDAVPAGVSASNVTGQSFGLFALSGTGNPAPAGGPFVSSQILGTDFLAFTVTPDAGNVLNLTSLSFDELNNNNAVATEFGVFTSLDGFTTAILGGPLVGSATYNNLSVNLAGPTFQGLAGPVTFRVAARNANGISNGGSGWPLDNITLTFDVEAAIAIPEPATASLGLLAFGSLMLRRRRLV